MNVIKGKTPEGFRGQLKPLVPCLFSFKWKQNVQEFTSQGQVSDTPPSRLYPGTPTLHQGPVCNNLSWWGGALYL